MRTIETYRAFGLCVLLASGVMMLEGCSDSGSGSGSQGAGGSGTTTGGTATGTTTGAGTGTGGGGNPQVTYCGDGANYPPPVPTTQALISDFEGEAGTSVLAIMPAGVWSADVDGTGTTQLDSFKVQPCGTTGNGFHFTGTGHTKWGADAAAAIVSQLQPVDINQYSGISFVLKSAAGSVSGLFKVQNPYSQPGCLRCDDANTDASDDCYSGYIKSISTSDAPQTVLFSDLAQQTWGYRPLGSAAFDKHNLVSIAIAFIQNVDFDVCIDDVKFVP